jgi:Undecaprenyl-phosphate glucose phosphotransferase
VNLRGNVASRDEVASHRSQSGASIRAAASPLDLAAPAARAIRLSEFLARLVALEFCVISSVTYTASIVYNIRVSGWTAPALLYIGAALFVATSYLLISASFRHYVALQTQSRPAFLWNGLGAVFFAFAFLLSAMFILKLTDGYSRITFIFQFVSVAIALLCVRAIAYSRLRYFVESGFMEARRVILLGDQDHCSQFCRRLKFRGIHTVGVFSFSDTDVNGSPDAGSRHRGLLDECRALRVDDILILDTQDNRSTTAELVEVLSELPNSLHIIPVDGLLCAASQIVEFGDVRAIQVSHPPLTVIEQTIKRAFDLVVAVTALVLLMPILVMVSLAIKLDSPGPILFRQLRHGYNNIPIRIFKFRSMSALEDGLIFRQASRHDSRITRIGRILRRTNIDELPQLLNVLLGEMSIVGPRPHALAHNQMFEGKILPLARRHNVKPGITGWAQVNGYRGETDTLEKMQRRVEYDLYYIDNWSLMFDLKIVIMTFFSKRAYLNAC